MTRVEVRIDRLVLRGVPAELAAGLGPRVEARIAELAAETPLRAELRDVLRHPERRDDRVAGGAELVDLVARSVWEAARREAGTG